MTSTSPPSPDELPPAPASLEWRERNEWINARTTQIQEAWHDLFDADTSDYAEENPRPDPLPRDSDDDLRLMFGLPDIDASTRAACFALLPAGAEMCRRFEEHVSSPATSMSPAEVRSLIGELARDVGRVVPDAEVDWDRVRLAAEADPGIRSMMMSTDDVPYLLEDLPETSQRGGDPASRAAYFFLTEALYNAAGNHYQLRDWVCAAMLDEDLDRIYEIIYRLWRAGWQVFCGEDGVVVVDRSG